MHSAPLLSEAEERGVGVHLNPFLWLRGAGAAVPGIAVPRGRVAVLPALLSLRCQSGDSVAAETAVNLGGRIAACKYIRGAQQVPRRIRPGEEMLQGEMKGSLQWNSCGISFPQEILPPNPP